MLVVSTKFQNVFIFGPVPKVSFVLLMNNARTVFYVLRHCDLLSVFLHNAILQNF